MALTGSLKGFRLPEIFQLIGLQGKSGVLVINKSMGRVTVYFESGNIVSAHDTRAGLDSRIGTIMVKSGLMTKEDLDVVLEHQKETGQRIGKIVVEQGLVDTDMVSNMLKVQALEIIYLVFKLQDGEYFFDPDAAVEREKDSFDPVPVEVALMEGMRMMDEWPKITKRIQSFGIVYRIKNELPQEDLQNLKVEEKLIYQRVDDKNTVEEIIVKTRLSQFVVCRVLYKLLENSVIEENVAKSRTVSLNVEFVNPFLYAAKKEIEARSKVKVIPGKPALKGPLDPARGDISSIMGITGQKRGSFALTFTKNCIKKIASDITGKDASFDDINLRNIVTELTRKVAVMGTERLNDKGYFFEPSLATTIVGERHYLNHDTGGPCIVIPFETDAGPFYAEISLEK